MPTHSFNSESLSPFCCHQCCHRQLPPSICSLPLPHTKSPVAMQSSALGFSATLTAPTDSTTLRRLPASPRLTLTALPSLRSPPARGLVTGASPSRWAALHFQPPVRAVRASAGTGPVPEGGAAEAKPAGEGVWRTLQLGALFGMWYLFNIYFNIYNKQVLKVFPNPITITTLQFATGSVLVLFMWATNLYKRPKISTSQLVAILPLALVHTLGNLFTNMSLGKVAVSFTHTIKAMEPFFSVLLSAMFLGEMPSLLVVASLLPIVGGVALASFTEASFNWAGFWSAMASNVTFQSRNVLSKKLMVKKEESLDNINLFSIITLLSFCLLSPVTFFTEGVKLAPSTMQAAGLNVQQTYTRALLAALCFHAYQQVSYMILARVTPVTHSVGNCVKRVVVIVTSVLFFRTPVSPVNSIGTGVALLGVFLYSQVKRIKPKAA